MAAVGRLKLRPPVLDQWSLKEKLALACSVMRSGDQNWVSVSRAIRPLGDDDRPGEWFSQKNCALQYAELLDKVETPKRKRGEKEAVETPETVIVRKLSVERIEELKKLSNEYQKHYLKLKQETEEINAGVNDDSVQDMWEFMQKAKIKKEEEGKLKTPVKEEPEEEKVEDIKPSTSFVQKRPVPPGLKITIKTEDPSGEKHETIVTVDDDASTTPAQDTETSESSTSNKSLSYLLQNPDAIDKMEEEQVQQQIKVEAEEQVIEEAVEVEIKPWYDCPIQIEDEEVTVICEDPMEVKVEDEGENQEIVIEDEPTEIVIEPEDENINVETEVEIKSPTPEPEAEVETLEEPPIITTPTTPKKQQEKEEKEKKEREEKEKKEREEKENEDKEKDEETETPTTDAAPDTPMRTDTEEPPLSPASSILSTETDQGSTRSSSRGRRSKSGKGRAVGRRSGRLRKSERKDTDTASKQSDAESSDDESKVDLDLSKSTVDLDISSVKNPLSHLESVPNSPASTIHGDEDEKAHKLWKKSIMLVWRAAANHKYANVFLHPVRDEIAPGYSTVVNRPMDLTQIKKSVECGMIRTTAEFQRDIMLMFTNAIMYNNSDHDVYIMAQEMYDDVMHHIEVYLSVGSGLEFRNTPGRKVYVNTQVLVNTDSTPSGKVLRASRRSELSGGEKSDKEDDGGRSKRRVSAETHDHGGKIKKRKP